MTIETDKPTGNSEQERRKKIRALNEKVSAFILRAAIFTEHPDVLDTVLNLNRPQNFSPLEQCVTDFFTIDGNKHPDVHVEARLHSDSSGNHMTVALVTGKGETKDQIRHITVTTDSISRGHARLEIQSSGILDPAIFASTNVFQRRAFSGMKTLEKIEKGPIDPQIALAESMIAFITHDSSNT